jgi:hypothetical protein
MGMLSSASGTTYRGGWCAFCDPQGGEIENMIDHSGAALRSMVAAASGLFIVCIQ